MKINPIKTFVYAGEELGCGNRYILPEPKFCTFAGVSVGIAAASLGLGAAEAGAQAAGVFTPSAPNMGAASSKMADIQASLLPQQIAEQAAAEIGGVTPVTPEIQTKIDSIKKQIALYQSIGKPTTKLQAELAKLQPNFTGYSTADIQRQMMTQGAQSQLEQAAKYDPQYIALAAQQAKEAAPQETAARQSMYDLVEKQIQNQPTSPVAQEMQRQIGEKFAAGSGLTPEEQSLLNQSVANMGNITGTKGVSPDLGQQLTTGVGGSQRELQNTLLGSQWLSSGETPQDIQYRQQQQNLANLSSFVSGQTPTSQFKQLSGAQQGATPLYQETALPTYNGAQAAQTGQQAALAGYGQQMTQANPWTVGLAGLSGAGQIATSLANK